MRCHSRYARRGVAPEFQNFRVALPVENARRRHRRRWRPTTPSCFTRFSFFSSKHFLFAFGISFHSFLSLSVHSSFLFSSSFDCFPLFLLPPLLCLFKRPPTPTNPPPRALHTHTPTHPHTPTHTHAHTRTHTHTGPSTTADTLTHRTYRFPTQPNCKNKKQLQKKINPRMQISWAICKLAREKTSETRGRTRHVVKGQRRRINWRCCGASRSMPFALLAADWPAGGHVTAP